MEYNLRSIHEDLTCKGKLERSSLCALVVTGAMKRATECVYKPECLDEDYPIMRIRESEHQVQDVMKVYV